MLLAEPPVATSVEERKYTHHTETLERKEPFACFDRPPKPGDSLFVGLSDPLPRCAVVLRFGCEIEGVGVDPKNPPIVWQAWDGKGWSACEVDRDETGGLNRDGDVILHVHRDHAASVIERCGPAGCVAG